MSALGLTTELTVLPDALWRIGLLDKFTVDELHQLMQLVVANYDEPRLSSRPLYVRPQNTNDVYLGWETCQSSLNMRLMPQPDVRYFDVNDVYSEVFIRPISSAEPEKRRCSCHGMPTADIDDLRYKFLVELARAIDTYRRDNR